MGEKVKLILVTNDIRTKMVSVREAPSKEVEEYAP